MVVIMARWTMASWWSGLVSWPRTQRRCLLIHAKLLSTTQMRGRTWKPCRSSFPGGVGLRCEVMTKDVRCWVCGGPMKPDTPVMTHQADGDGRLYCSVGCVADAHPLTAEQKPRLGLLLDAVKTWSSGWLMSTDAPSHLPLGPQTGSRRRSTQRTGSKPPPTLRRGNWPAPMLCWPSPKRY